jgi:hypothetical protein
MKEHKHKYVIREKGLKLWVDWLNCEPFLAEADHVYCENCLDTTYNIIRELNIRECTSQELKESIILSDVPTRYHVDFMAS